MLFTANFYQGQVRLHAYFFLLLEATFPNFDLLTPLVTTHCYPKQYTYTYKQTATNVTYTTISHFQ